MGEGKGEKCGVRSLLFKERREKEERTTRTTREERETILTSSLPSPPTHIHPSTYPILPLLPSSSSHPLSIPQILKLPKPDPLQNPLLPCSSSSHPPSAQNLTMNTHPPSSSSSPTPTHHPSFRHRTRQMLPFRHPTAQKKILTSRISRSGTWCSCYFCCEREGTEAESDGFCWRVGWIETVFGLGGGWEEGAVYEEVDEGRAGGGGGG